MNGQLHFIKEFQCALNKWFGTTIPAPATLRKYYNHPVLIGHFHYGPDNTWFRNVFGSGYNAYTVHEKGRNRFVELFTGHDSGRWLIVHPGVDEKRINIMRMVSEQKTWSGCWHVFGIDQDGAIKCSL